MKKDTHPKEYRVVVYKDSTTGDMWLTRSTAKSTENIKFEDGNEYPLVSIHISSKSHPFFTGEEKLIDTEGRVDKFAARRDLAKKLATEKATKFAEAKKASNTKKKEA
jgi:large subunit ribosomal protein L31